MTFILQTAVAVVAGFLLNLTPCVLPAIPLKIRSILNETGTGSRHRLAAAAAFLAGTLAFFLALGGATALLHLTWGGLFQSRTFLGLLSAFLLLSGIVEFLDVSIPLPRAVYRVHGRRFMEPFLSGALTGVLATPCTGFFLGGVLAYALTRPPIVTLWLFAAIGTGLALPYVVVVLRPEWLSRLPRGGEWTARSREILGFALLGGSIFFARILLPESFETPLWFLWAAGLAVWAAASWARDGRWPAKVFASVFAAAGVSLVLAASAPSKDPFLPWEPYGETSLASARSRGVPALIEFTADWCINCKVLEKTAYRAPGVVRAAREIGMAAYRVDLTESDPEKEALLASFGGVGIPFAVILSPRGEVVARLPDLFTSSALEEAIRRAGAAERDPPADSGGSEESPMRKDAIDGTPDRPKKTVPRGKNRLALETSPYLLKHAENPVDWYPWGKEAFARAKSEDKLIFLSIGYSTCYWCSVMERESFADPSVADLMNRYVVSVKVDREERPDLDGIYMTAVMLMTGQGGWPMSVLLTPDRKPFFGATYFPKRAFMELLEAAHAAWTGRRGEVMAQAERVAEAVAAAGEAPGGKSESLPSADLVGSAARRFGESFDPENGGFGGAPKFPRPSILELLMSHFEMTGERSSMSMVERTLEAMARGGIHDQAGGGFHRYSTDPKWLVPHFEKMLYDQAQLLHAYARAYALTGNEEFRRVSGRIAAYVEREMTSETGLFYSAQDSEVDGEEGKPYVWSGEELRRALGDAEYALAGRIYGLSGPPNFEGRYILYRPVTYEDAARGAGLPVPDLLEKADAIDAKILALRRKRPQPALDDKSIASWNGLMIEALAYAGGVLKDDRYVRMASRAADDLLKTLRNDGGDLLRVSRGGSAKLDAYLDDYAAAVLGLLELHRVTGTKRWLSEADRIGNAMVERLWEPGGGFRYAARSVDFLIASPRDSFDGAFPSANGLAARAMTGLAAAGRLRYARYAAQTLAVYEPAARDTPHALPYMLWGLHEYRLAKLPGEIPPAERPVLPSTAGLVRIEGRLSRNSLSPGEPEDLVVTLRIDDGWHLNANPASAPSLVPTSLDVVLDGGEVTFTPRYPEGKIIFIGPEKERISVYDKTIDLEARIVPVRLPPGSREGRLSISVRAQACNDTGRCLAPATIRTDVPLRFPGEETAR